MLLATGRRLRRRNHTVVGASALLSGFLVRSHGRRCVKLPLVIPLAVSRRRADDRGAMDVYKRGRLPMLNLSCDTQRAKRSSKKVTPSC